MISDELLSKFDSIEDLPISEEMLGAYMEGSLDIDKTIICEDIMAQDSSLNDLFFEITNDPSIQSDDELIFSFDSDFLDNGIDTFLTSPDVNLFDPASPPDLSFEDSYLHVNNQILSDFHSEEEYSNYSEDTLINDRDETYITDFDDLNDSQNLNDIGDIFGIES